MSMWRRWFYIEYIGTFNCPRCGIVGMIEIGMLCGNLRYKILHRQCIDSRYFTYKVCYY